MRQPIDILRQRRPPHLLPEYDVAPVGVGVPRRSGRQLVNGAMMSYGKGRIVVMGEAAMFSAQLAGAQRQKQAELRTRNPAPEPTSTCLLQ
ncbi:MAG: hypothetical protein IPI11_02400 [Haliscomenobacter sp.]|nr:hypothetical protein [Haliscomenobacter sp.]